MRNKVIIGSIIILIVLGAIVMLFNNKIFLSEENLIENPIKPTETLEQSNSVTESSNVSTNTNSESEYIEPTLVKINGYNFPYYEIERPKKLTEEMFEEIELGTEFWDIEDKFGERNGELNFNVILINIFYKIDENRFIILHFDGAAPYGEQSTHLLGMGLYDSEGLIKIIKGDMGPALEQDSDE